MKEKFCIRSQKQELTVVVPDACPRIVRYTAEQIVDKLNEYGLVKAVLAQESDDAAECELLIGCTKRCKPVTLAKNHYRIEVSGEKLMVYGENETALAGGANMLLRMYNKSVTEQDGFVIDGPIDGEFVPERNDYKLVWHDEFDSDELNRKLWVSQSKPYVTTSCLGTPCHGMKAFNATQRDGKAVMWANRDPDTNEFFHGQICTKGTHRFLYGCMEIRAKLSELPGANALWFVSHYPGAAGGVHSEIDLLEDFAMPDAFNANIHRWGAQINSKTGEKRKHTSLDGGIYSQAKKYTCPEGTEPLRNDYHLYTLQWDCHKMSFCVDGKAFFTYDIDHDLDGFGTAAFHRPLYTLLSTTMGASTYGAKWKQGDPDRVEILVDYIRLYQRDCDDGYSIETQLEAEQTELA